MNTNKLCGDLLTSKELPESHVTWVTSVPILVFQDLCVLELDTMYATDIQTSDTHDCLMPPTLMAGHNNESRKTSYHWYQKCVYPCGETTISPLGHLLRTCYPIRKKKRISQVFLSSWGNDIFSPQDYPVRKNEQHRLNESFLYGVVSIVRELGIYLDSSLTMTDHISRTVSNCFAALRQVCIVFAGHFPCGCCHRSADAP